MDTTTDPEQTVAEKTIANTIEINYVGLEAREEVFTTLIDIIAYGGGPDWQQTRFVESRVACLD